MEGSSFEAPEIRTDLTNFDPSNIIKIMPEGLKELESFSISVKEEKMGDDKDLTPALTASSLLDSAALRSATLPSSITLN